MATWCCGMSKPKTNHVNGHACSPSLGTSDAYTEVHNSDHLSADPSCLLH